MLVGAVALSFALSSGGPAGDPACRVRGDDGVWRSCAEALAALPAHRAAESDALSAPTPAVPDLARARALLDAADTSDAGPPPAPAVVRSKLELEYEAAGVDTKLPLVALRIDVARREEQAARDFEAQTQWQREAGVETDPEAERLAVLRAALDDLERVGFWRMNNCLVQRQHKPLLNYRMTPAGPVMLTGQEMAAQARAAEQTGCYRALLIDAYVVGRATRRQELKHILATRTFEYGMMRERQALQEELSALDAEIERQAIPMAPRAFGEGTSP